MIRYSGGVVEWRKLELHTLARKTRTLPFENGTMRQNSNVIRLYTSRKEGGRGLIGIEKCVASERKLLNWHLINSGITLLNYVAKSQNLVKERI